MKSFPSLMLVGAITFLLGAAPGALAHDNDFGPGFGEHFRDRSPHNPTTPSAGQKGTTYKAGQAGTKAGQKAVAAGQKAGQKAAAAGQKAVAAGQKAVAVGQKAGQKASAGQKATAAGQKATAAKAGQKK